MERAADMTKARLSTLGSTAAGITAITTAEEAAMTAVTTNLPLKEGWKLNEQFFHTFFFHSVSEMSYLHIFPVQHIGWNHTILWAT